MDIKKFKSQIKTKIIFYVITFLLLVSTVIIINTGVIPGINRNTEENSFFNGFINGLTTSFLFGLIFVIVKYITIINNKEKLKKEYIKCTDELECKIAEEIGKSEYIFIVIGLIFGIIVGGFLNMMIFWSFYIALMYYCVVRRVLYIIHKRKY